MRRSEINNLMREAQAFLKEQGFITPPFVTWSKEEWQARGRNATRSATRCWGESGHGLVLTGEVSQRNDDTVDNRFLEKTGRFPSIEEDDEPLSLLCNEYPRAR